MRIEEFLDTIVDRYKMRIDKHSDIFKVDSFSMDKVSLNKDEKKWLQDNNAMTQMVYIPIENRGQKPGHTESMKFKYLQLENGLYISPSLFKFMNFYEAKAKRDMFPTIL